MYFKMTQEEKNTTCIVVSVIYNECTFNEKGI